MSLRLDRQIGVSRWPEWVATAICIQQAGARCLDSRFQIPRYLDYVFWISMDLGVLQACMSAWRTHCPSFLPDFVEICIRESRMVTQCGLTQLLEKAKVLD